jgi:pimeloyl-ACP methyl ester carboxylesterase
MTPPVHRFSTANRMRLHALDYGGRGRTVVFLHGVTGHAWMFDGAAAHLDRRARVLSVDLRGHGDSQWSSTAAYGTAEAAQDVAELVQSLGGTVDLVGSSWGGLVALRAATDVPRLVRRIVVLDAAPVTDRSPDDVRPRPAEFSSHAEIVEWERTQRPRTADDLVELLANQGYRPTLGGLLTHKFDPIFLRHWAFRGEDHRDALTLVQQPTLVVRGASSPALSAEEAVEMVDRLPAGHAATLAAAGHLPELDDPAGVARLVADFLK